MSETESDADALPDGTLIDGRYRLTGQLGRGGFAWVYEAEHTELGRPAAVKVLDPPRDKASRIFARRFLREARIVARLSHPNVVTVYDFGTHEPTGQPYLAMELLQGHDLHEELRKSGPLHPERAKRLFVGALDALRAAHNAGVVHKDLKPSNLFLASADTATERLVLLDFGMAWAFDQSDRLTQAGAFTGTPAYVAPEYARNQEVSSAVDVYQLGLILSEALSGVPCVANRSPLQMLFAHSNGSIVIPDSVRSSPFGPIVEKATSLEPRDRYRDGGEFGDALSEVDARVARLPPETTSGPSTAQERLEQADEDDRDSPPITLPTAAFDEEGRKTDGESNEAIELEPATEPARPKRARAARSSPRTTERARREDPDASDESELGWAWYAAGVAGLGVIVAIAFMATRPKPPRRPPPDTEPGYDEPVVVIEPGEPDVSAELELQPRFTISTSPIGAVVYQGDRRLGRTPVVIRGDEVDGSKAELDIKLDGYKSTTRTVSLEDGARIDIELESTRKPTQQPPPRRPGLPLEELLRKSQRLRQSKPQKPTYGRRGGAEITIDPQN